MPWEDVSPVAVWVSTMWRTEPWSNDDVSPFRMVPCDQSRAANFYKSDPFHIFKYGIGRRFCASCIVVLCQWGYFPASTQNIVDLLSNAHTDFRWTCKNEIAHGSPHMKGFTKELFHFPRNALFPWGGWKGSDTLLLFRWLLRVLHHGVKVEGQPARPIIHQPNLWETRDDGYKLVESVELFCSAYAFLATTMLNDGTEPTMVALNRCSGHILQYGDQHMENTPTIPQAKHLISTSKISPAKHFPSNGAPNTSATPGAPRTFPQLWDHSQILHGSFGLKTGLSLVIPSTY